MDNRRKETRKKLMAFTPVYTSQGRLLGFLENLTLQGAMVIGEKPLAVDTHERLLIEFSDELPGAFTRQITINARVARCAKEEDSPRNYNIGLEFVETDSEQMEIIQSLLNRYHFRHQTH